MTVELRRVELWCDSFHEGAWAAEGILKQWPKAIVTRSHRLGFIPQYSVQLGQVRLELEVFGGYGNWSDLPTKIRELLDWGKPDIVVYDRSADTVLFAVEETAAVPTGNQALQRCERMHGAGTMKVPFWYLLSQFGTHVDEGTRQASPWPALMAVALTATFRTPNIVLLYSSEASPEDYAAGEGMVQLFRMLAKMLENYATTRKLLDGLDAELTSHFASMLRFIGETYANVTDFLPRAELLADPATASRLAGIASGSDGGRTSFPLLDWPKFKELPAAFRKKQTEGTFIKTDPFLARLEAGRETGNVYTLSGNAGSRPQPENDLKSWIDQQRKLHAGAQALSPPVEFKLKLDDFPESNSGLRHVTMEAIIEKRGKTIAATDRAVRGHRKAWLLHWLLQSTRGSTAVSWAVASRRRWRPHLVEPCWLSEGRVPANARFRAGRRTSMTARAQDDRSPAVLNDRFQQDPCRALSISLVDHLERIFHASPSSTSLADSERINRANTNPGTADRCNRSTR